METLLAGLFVAALGGLGFVAYRHPARFQKLATPLHIAGAAFIVALFVYYSGFLAGTLAMWPFVDGAKIQAATDASKAKGPPMTPLLFSAIVFMLYVSLLQSLDRILKRGPYDTNKT